MYGPYVRDKFPARNHLSTILDVDIDHRHGWRHPLVWLIAIATIAGAAAWAWHAGYLPQ